MRVKGLLWSARGTLIEVDAATGAFTVDFDLPIGSSGDSAKQITFGQRGTEVVDTKWGHTWEIIS